MSEETKAGSEFSDQLGRDETHGKCGHVNWIVTESEMHSGRFSLQASLWRCKTGYFEGTREEAEAAAQIMAKEIDTQLRV